MGLRRGAFIVKLERLHITAFLGLGALVWWLVLGAPRVSWEYLQPFGTVVGFLVAFGAAFEFLLWRWSWLHGWFVKRPDLRGTWRVELQSDWIKPSNESRRAAHRLLYGRCADPVNSSDAPDDTGIRVLVHCGTYQPLTKRSRVPSGGRVHEQAANAPARGAQRNASGRVASRHARPDQPAEHPHGRVLD